MVWHGKCSQGKNKWGKLHGPPGQWGTGEHYHPEIKEHSLPVGLITNLMGSKVTCVGLGNTYTRLLGYVVIWVQVEGVWGYDEDQIALIIPDFLNFEMRVPIILGTPTIRRVVNVMKEAEVDALAMLWVNARVAHLLAVRRMTPVEVGDDQEGRHDTDQDGPLMYTQKEETLEPLAMDNGGILGRKSEHDGASLACPGWYFATWPHRAEHIH